MDVHPRRDPSPELRRLTAAQSDLISTEQAIAMGLSDDAVTRLVRQQHWVRLANGLFDTAPGHDSIRKMAWAAALLADQPYALGGDLALALHGLDRKVRVAEVWVPPDRRPRSVGRVAMRRDKLGRLERSVGSPVRISAEDAVLDVGQRLRVEPLVALISDAVRLRITTLDRLSTGLAQRKRVRQRALIAALLADLEGIESTLEYVYRRDVERAHGLPDGRRQLSLQVGSRTDVLYDEQSTLVELDGRFGHEDGASAFRDLRRDNTHVRRNLVSLRYGTVDVRGRPCEVAWQVWRTLADRGWTRPFADCPRCTPISHLA